MHSLCSTYSAMADCSVKQTWLRACSLLYFLQSLSSARPIGRGPRPQGHGGSHSARCRSAHCGLLTWEIPPWVVERSAASGATCNRNRISRLLSLDSRAAAPDAASRVRVNRLALLVLVLPARAGGGLRQLLFLLLLLNMPLVNNGTHPHQHRVWRRYPSTSTGATRKKPAAQQEEAAS